jgi:uncharacterized protein YndB with AHSA1/START domain
MDKNKPKFVHVTYINTTPEKLWTALTTADFTQKYWMGQRIDSDWKGGSPVKFAKPDGIIKHIGEVLRFEPPKILSYSWLVITHIFSFVISGILLTLKKPIK